MGVVPEQPPTAPTPATSAHRQSVRDVEVFTAQIKQGIQTMIQAIINDRTTTERAEHTANAKSCHNGFQLITMAWSRLDRDAQITATLMLQTQIQQLYTTITETKVIDNNLAIKVLHFNSLRIHDSGTSFEDNIGFINTEFETIVENIRVADKAATAAVYTRLLITYYNTLATDLDVLTTGEQTLSFIRRLPANERSPHVQMLLAALETSDAEGGAKLRQQLHHELQQIHSDLPITNMQIDVLIRFNRTAFTLWKNAKDVWAAASTHRPRTATTINNNRTRLPPPHVPQRQGHQQQAPPHGNGDPPHSMSTQHCDAHHYDYINRCPHCTAKRTHCPACKLNSKFIHGPNNDSCLVCNASDTVLEKTLAGTRQVLRMAKAYRASHGVTGL
jgi:hypothetical protein